MELELKRAGLMLRGRLERANVEKGPLLLMLHGFGGDMDARPGSVFQTISEQMTELGISTLRFDFNGHGMSDGNFTEMTPLNEIEDAIAVLNYARKLEFVTDVYLLGHSQGGVIAGMTAGYYADIVSKLVLLAPAASLKTDAQSGRCMQAVYDTKHIPDSVDVDGGHHIVGGQYFRIAKTLPIYEVTGQFQHPTLIVHGKQDEVVSLEGVMNYQKVLADCRLCLYDNLNHGLYGKNQQDMYRNIREFLK